MGTLNIFFTWSKCFLLLPWLVAILPLWKSKSYTSGGSFSIKIEFFPLLKTNVWNCLLTIWLSHSLSIRAATSRTWNIYSCQRYSATKRNNIQLSLDWMPRCINGQADYLSKIVDFEEWCVSEIYCSFTSTHWLRLQLTVFTFWENAKIQVSLQIL